MVAVPVGEQDLRPHLRQGVGRIDHDVVAELHAVLVEQAPEAEVGRRSARARAARGRAGGGRGPRRRGTSRGRRTRARGTRSAGPRPRRRRRRPEGLPSRATPRSTPSGCPARGAVWHPRSRGRARPSRAAPRRGRSRRRRAAAAPRSPRGCAEVKASSPLNALIAGAPPMPAPAKSKSASLSSSTYFLRSPERKTTVLTRTPNSLTRASARARLRSGSRYSTSIFGVRDW